MTHRRPDFPLLAFSNAYAISGFLLGFCFLILPSVARLDVWMAALSVPAGATILLLSWQSHRKRDLRRRIYRLLERRIAKRGFRQELFRHLCGGPCLRFQHRLLFLRAGAYREYRLTMRRFRKSPLVYFSHPDEELEDELNFGASADDMRDQLTVFSGGLRRRIHSLIECWLSELRGDDFRRARCPKYALPRLALDRRVVGSWGGSGKAWPGPKRKDGG
jgi:hypothetical protein